MRVGSMLRFAWLALLLMLILRQPGSAVYAMEVNSNFSISDMPDLIRKYLDHAHNMHDPAAEMPETAVAKGPEDMFEMDEVHLRVLKGMLLRSYKALYILAMCRLVEAHFHDVADDRDTVQTVWLGYEDLCNPLLAWAGTNMVVRIAIKIASPKAKDDEDWRT
ncbi:hypothetical protein ACEQ8H_008517 [Pleosporales sp. CAS-2024a]